MMQLYIANKNYSSWSMRPWLVLKAFDLAFEEIQLNFPCERGEGDFKQRVLEINPNGKVPALLDQGMLIWDSLAICEYLAEQYPEQALWPRDVQQRAWARSISAEMHSGFTDLRSLCGMNIRANLAEVGTKLWQEHSGLRQDVARIEHIWSARPAADGFLCGEFSIADAFYAPVVTRFMTYALPVSANSQHYMQRVMQHPAMRAWVHAASQEAMFVNYLEPYQIPAK